MQANASVGEQAKVAKHQARVARKEMQELTRALRKKEKALADKAALLVLRKKGNAIGAKEEDE